jgi:hypothetical protein
MKKSSRFAPSLVCIKPVKTGGSTVSGVVRRIGDRFNLSGTRSQEWIRSEPGLWASHISHMAFYNHLHSRIAELSGPRFLLTWVRHPIDRCLSHFYWDLSKGRLKDTPSVPRSRNPWNYTDEDILRFSRNDSYYGHCRKHMENYLGMPGDVSAETILKRYNFIGTTERFAESMILLMDKLPIQVNLGDILYLVSKNSSRSNDLVRTKRYAEQSQRVRDFFDSKEFREVNAIDFELWHTANKMLDRQGRAFGRERLERETAEYQHLLAEADAKCYVANMQSAKRDCYSEDCGCGISCLNSVAAQKQAISSESVDRCHKGDSCHKEAPRGYTKAVLESSSLTEPAR